MVDISVLIVARFRNFSDLLVRFGLIRPILASVGRYLDSKSSDIDGKGI